MADGWTPRPELVGQAPEQGHALFRRDGASITECRSRVAEGVEILQGAVRWYKRENGRDVWAHEIFGGFTVPTALPELSVSRRRKLGLPSKRDGDFPADEFDEQMRVTGDEAFAERLLKPPVRSFIAEHLHHTRWELTVGGLWVTIGTEAGVFGNDDVAVESARYAWLLHQVAHPDLVVERFYF